jgi:hypothetical protein
MDVFKMVAIIAVVAIIAGVIKAFIERKNVPEVDLSEIEGRLDKLESLQQRIQTLEAIVTDKGYDLKHKIDSLK